VSAIFDLLAELSIDTFRLDDFLRDPDPLLASWGIGLEEAPLVMSPASIAADGTWERSAVAGDPGYDPLPDPDVPEPEEDDAA
jgi:hypothetical protein